MKKDNLGDRMKTYESNSKLFLTRRIPVIIRLDGKAFHTFTRGMKKPFDEILMQTMQETMKFLCENIQGCVFGYTQSDEITLVLTDYATIKTDAWFGYNIQKMASVSASMTTLAFNKFFKEKINEYGRQTFENWDEGGTNNLINKELLNQIRNYEEKFDKAIFDSRVFSLPKEEVCNCLIWRQQDATRNSIQAVGQANFSQKQLEGKSCNQIQEMLFSEKGINWNDYPTDCKRGACCYKQFIKVGQNSSGDLASIITRKKWVIDKNIPIFTQSRFFIEQWL